MQLQPRGPKSWLDFQPAGQVKMYASDCTTKKILHTPRPSFPCSKATSTSLNQSQAGSQVAGYTVSYNMEIQGIGTVLVPVRVRVNASV
jgi:hypothetical protein